MKPRIRLEARNEGLSYEDASGTYRFKIELQCKRWVVKLPPTKGNAYQRRPLSAEERGVLLPQITAYLSRIRWFGIWPCNYEVTFGE